MRSRLAAGSFIAAATLSFSSAARAQLTFLGSQFFDQDSSGIEGQAEPGDSFGTSLAAADFNCDGFDDVAIGVPFEDVDFDGASRVSAGAVQIFYGGPKGAASDGADELLTEADAVGGSDDRAESPETGDHFGAAVAAYISSDCGPRLAVGAPDEDYFGHTNAGRVLLFRYSQASGHFIHVNTFEQGDINVAEDEDGDEFGYAIAAVDFNDRAGCPGNFPLPGLAIGAPGEDTFVGNSDGGAVYVFRGRNCSTGQPYEWEKDQVIEDTTLCGSNTPGGDTITECLILRQDSPDSGTVPESDDRFGESISGRAHNRIIIGSPGENSGAGMVQTFTERADGTIGIEIFNQDVLTNGAAETNDGFGSALAEGDFDDDGDFDLAVGVPGEDIQSDTIASAGAVAVIRASGADLQQTGDQLWSQDDFTSAVAEDVDHFGTSLVAGDFNGDGADDLAIGVPNEDVGGDDDAGAINVLYSDGNGLSASGNQTFTQDTPSIPSPADPCDVLGTALAAGNFDGANGADLAIGVPGEGGVCDTVNNGPPFPSENEGAINVLYSSINGLLSQISASFSPSPVAEDAGASTITVTKTGSAVIAASIHLQTSNDTAVSNVDYFPLDLDALWPAGDNSDRTVDLQVIDNPDDEPNRSLDLHLLTPSVGATVVGGATIPLTIQDDDVFGSFADNWETSATDAWSSATATGNSFDQSTLFPYAGEHGLRLDLEDTSNIFVRDNRPFSTTYHARFYTAPLFLDMAQGDAFDIFAGFTTTGLTVFKILLVGGASNARSMIVTVATDTGGVLSPAIPFPDGYRAIEISWRAAAAPGISNGMFNLKLDGTTEWNMTGIDNDTMRIDSVRLGAVTGLDAGTSGELPFDDFGSSASSNLNQISAFGDVAKAAPLWNFIHAMYNDRVTKGCSISPRTFCPNGSVLREHLAALLIRAHDGPRSSYPLCTNATPAPFADVDFHNPFCTFIKPLKERGISPTGCGGGNFCPKNPVRRGELAVLVLRTLGDLPTTSCSTKPFNDVEITDPRCPFIRDIGPAGLGISNGCGGGNFCPDQPIRRQELAILLQRAFDYRLPVSP